MRSEEGKSSIKLILIITAIVIVTVIGIIAIKDFISEENVKNLQADLLIVKTKVETLKGKNTLNGEENPLRGYQLTQLPENVDISEFLSKNIITQEEYEKYYLLDLESMQNMELQDLVDEYDGYFIVNYDDFEVIYSNGYKNENGVWCYKISELEKESELETRVENLVVQLKENIISEGTTQEQTEGTTEENTEDTQEQTEEANER